MRAARAANEDFIGGRAAINISDLSTSASRTSFAKRRVAASISLSELDWWASMLDSEFKRQRTQVLRELAEKANDPFIKKRLVALMSRYDDTVVVRPLTPIDLKFQTKATGPEQ
jgi:hypothetical protein